MNCYSTGTSSPGQYGTPNQYQGVHASTYQHHMQRAVPIPYASGQSVGRSHPPIVHFIQLLVYQTCDIYPESEVDAQWTSGHHHLSADLHRSDSWPRHHVSHSAPQMSLVCSYVIESRAVY